MILHLRYRSVCRYAHSGRSFFLLPFPRICCQHVRCLFSMGYNTTAAACPCSHPVKTRTVSRHFHTISHHFSTYNQQFYQNMYCFLLSFHKIHVSFLSCYMRLPKNLAENGSQKGFTIFHPDAMPVSYTHLDVYKRQLLVILCPHISCYHLSISSLRLCEAFKLLYFTFILKYSLFVPSKSSCFLTFPPF